ncbi:MAG: BTAD domain-containing putative transcriptional regulator [Candidatus Promineifilaceae bacterium]|nr:BTAD domain-containing putative transcriptional regulator [Candidatus Promineifilaceae bacterium]
MRVYRFLGTIQLTTDDTASALVNSTKGLDAPRFNEWLRVAQERLRREVSEGYRRLSTGLDLKGQWAEAIPVARRWLKMDPLDEVAQEWLMRLLVKSGRNVAALEHYEVSRQLLLKELGLEPGLQMTALAQQIRSGRQRMPAQLEATDQKLSEASADWNDIPLVGSFFGRRTELAQLQAWLNKGERQMVVIFGIGGVGKTTLAARAIEVLADRFDAVIWRSLPNAPMLQELLPSIRKPTRSQYNC